MKKGSLHFWVSIFVSVYLFTCTCFFATLTNAAEPNKTQAFSPPGKYDVCWIGNTFSGSGGENGFGYWTQNGADEIEVSPNGLVLAGCDWDEAGRCVGLYRDGHVNRILLKQEDAPETAWGWNTGNHAVAIEGNSIFVANLGKRLLRFTGNVDDLDSWCWKDEVELTDEPVGANAKNDVLAIIYKNRLELRSTKDLQLLAKGTFVSPKNSEELRDVAIHEDGAIWLLAGKKIRVLRFQNGRFSEGKVGEFSTLQQPTALAFDVKNPSILIVCDDGPDQQIKFFDITHSDTPKLTKIFGEKGGLFSQTVDANQRKLADGETFATRFYSPRGAGTDADGNLYVSLGFNGAPVGTFVLRSFTPDGKLRWEVANHAFVDTFGFDPDADGGRVYSRTAIFELNPDSPNADLDWHQTATSIDHFRYSKEADGRPFYGSTAAVKKLAGHRLYYTIGQYGGGYQFYSFDEKNGGQIARPAGAIRSKDETWAWNMDENGDVWHGDFHQNRTIRRYSFKGWKEEPSTPGVSNLFSPIFDTENPQEWPWPEDFELVRRVVYIAATDTLYLSGYLKTDDIDTWGVCGKTLRKYEHWTSKKPKIAWTVSLPINPTGENGNPLSPQGLAIAGDYIFCGMVKPDDGMQRTWILSAMDGSKVGAFQPGGEVGVCAGWQDMPYSIDAIQRKNGDYLIMVEEDWRGKNIIYRWTPDPKR